MAKSRLKTVLLLMAWLLGAGLAPTAAVGIAATTANLRAAPEPPALPAVLPAALPSQAAAAVPVAPPKDRLAFSVIAPVVVVSNGTPLGVCPVIPAFRGFLPFGRRLPEPSGDAEPPSLFLP